MLLVVLVVLVVLLLLPGSYKAERVMQSDILAFGHILYEMAVGRWAARNSIPLQQGGSYSSSEQRSATAVA